jgi:hypothetical protein
MEAVGEQEVQGPAWRADRRLLGEPASSPRTPAGRATGPTWRARAAGRAGAPRGRRPWLPPPPVPTACARRAAAASPPRPRRARPAPRASRVATGVLLWWPKWAPRGYLVLWDTLAHLILLTYRIQRTMAT